MLMIMIIFLIIIIIIIIIDVNCWLSSDCEELSGVNNGWRKVGLSSHPPGESATYEVGRILSFGFFSSVNEDITIMI